MALPPPPRFRQRVEAHQQKYADKNRARNEKRRREAIQAAKDAELLRNCEGAVADLAREISRREKVPIESAISMARLRLDMAQGTSTTASGSIFSIDYGYNKWPT